MTPLSLQTRIRLPKQILTHCSDVHAFMLTTSSMPEDRFRVAARWPSGPVAAALDAVQQSLFHPLTGFHLLYAARNPSFVLMYA